MLISGLMGKRSSRFRKPTPNASTIRNMNPVAWFRYGVGITGASVSQWDDQSGNVHPLKQGTGSAQPALQPDRSVLFDGTQQFLACDPFTLNQPMTEYLAVKQISWTLNDVISDGNTDGTKYFYQSDVANKLRIFAGSALAPTDIPLAAYFAAANVYNGAASSYQINNGVMVSGNSGASNPGGYFLGCNGGAANSHFANVQAKESILFSSAHASDTRAKLGRYTARVAGVAFAR